MKRVEARPDPIPFYPVLIVAAYVLNAWRDTTSGLGIMIRPLLIAVVAVGLLLLIVKLVAPRRLGVAAIVITILLVLIEGEFGGLTDLASRLESQVVVVVWYALLIAAAAVAAWIGIRMLRRPGAVAAFTRFANVLGVALLFVVTVTSVLDGSAALAFAEVQLASQVTAEQSSADNAPDIYVILLDAHPRADELRDRYGLDEPGLAAALEEREFDVSEGSQANYMFTQQTLASLFQMRHLVDIPEVMRPKDGSSNHALRMAVLDNPAFDVLREHGYEIVTVAAGYDSVRMSSADRVVDTGQVSAFERHLIRRTVLIDALATLWPDWLPGQLRDRVRGVFDATADLAAEPHARPRFTWVHVPSPHAPILFRADGSPQEVPDIHTFQADSPQGVGLSRDEFVAETLEQLEYLEQLTTGLVDEIISASDGEAVIVVMSDHGFRVDVTLGEPSDPDLDERFGTLLAAHTPGHADLFGDTPTNINVMPILLNAYAGADLECQPDEAFANGQGGYLDLHPVPAYDGASPADCGRGGQ